MRSYISKDSLEKLDFQFFLIQASSVLNINFVIRTMISVKRAIYAILVKFVMKKNKFPKGKVITT